MSVTNDAKILDRLPTLVAERSTFHPIMVERANDPEHDDDGSASSFLKDDLKFFGCADFLLKKDVESFRSQLSQSAKIMISLFERHDAGKPISDSYVSMLSYKSLFDALAAGDLDTAQRLAEMMGGRDKTEKHHDHPFDYTMGYATKAKVLEDHNQMKVWIPKLKETCIKTKSKSFLGYPHLYQAIVDSDLSSADAALEEIVKGHKKLSKGRGIFAGMEDEAISVWGLGSANLARWRGLAVNGIEPLIPVELLIPVAG